MSFFDNNFNSKSNSFFNNLTSSSSNTDKKVFRRGIIERKGNDWKIDSPVVETAIGLTLGAIAAKKIYDFFKNND